MKNRVVSKENLLGLIDGMISDGKEVVATVKHETHANFKRIKSTGGILRIPEAGRTEGHR